MSGLSKSCCLWAISSSGFLLMNCRKSTNFFVYMAFVVSSLAANSSCQYFSAADATLAFSKPFVLCGLVCWP